MTTAHGKLVLLSPASKYKEIEVNTTEVGLKRYSTRFDRVWPDISCDDQKQESHSRFFVEVCPWPGFMDGITYRALNLFCLVSCLLFEQHVDGLKLK